MKYVCFIMYKLSDARHAPERLGGATQHRKRCPACGNAPPPSPQAAFDVLYLAPGAGSLEAAVAAEFGWHRRVEVRCDGAACGGAACECAKELAVLGDVLVVRVHRVTLRRPRDARPLPVAGTLAVPPGAGPGAPAQPLRLAAFTLRDGETTGAGHYRAVVSRAGAWFLCDDRNVSPVPTSEALAMAAQGDMLFFERQ